MDKLTWTLIFGGVFIFYFAWAYDRNLKKITEHLDDFSYRLSELEKNKSEISDDSD